MTTPPAITLSRTLGSGGTEVALHVARQLGWHFYDRRILRQTATAMQLPVEALRIQEERPFGFLEQLLRFTVLASPEVPYVPPLELPAYSRDLFEVERTVMLALVEKQSAVLVGRGGFIALKDRPATLHVRVQASLDFRIQHLLDRGKATNRDAAKQAILTSDRDRKAFYREIANLEWEDPKNFHLVLDPSTHGLKACAERIIEEAKGRFQ